MSLQNRPVLNPLLRLVIGVGDHLEAGMSDRGLGILSEAPDAVRHIGESMLAIGLPQPIRSHRREIAESGLALAQGMRDLPQLGGLLLQSARARGECRKQCGDTDRGA